VTDGFIEKNKSRDGRDNGDASFNRKMKKVKNINQTDLLELLERMEQLQEIELELNMTSALGPLELNLVLNGNMTATAISVEENIINEKQIDWVTLDASC
jgi:hypothetical protein